MKKQNTSHQKTWALQILDPNDGSGDGILPLPDELLKALGWQENDSIDVSLDETGSIRLNRKS
ncbi:Hypothetical protein HEAR3219 [Herminiimonas arsenicoxydans]|uniref:SpoVT-AbrB domain-containing protein n=1 Tax=Herminiimonas arsenicoxydans TaxID=204773 RepID=A4G9Z0_HERAR|nr:Hypothetical protein HEAR3219 [Herminiimonas arsenicoxydans]